MINTELSFITLGLNISDSNELQPSALATPQVYMTQICAKLWKPIQKPKPVSNFYGIARA